MKKQAKKYVGKLVNKDNLLICSNIVVEDYSAFVQIGTHVFSSKKINRINNKDGSGSLDFEQGWRVIW
jgi:hypothetical protein